MYIPKTDNYHSILTTSNDFITITPDNEKGLILIQIIGPRGGVHSSQIIEYKDLFDLIQGMKQKGDLGQNA